MVARAGTNMFRETSSVGVIGAWGITKRTLHLAPRARWRRSDQVAAAAGANLRFECAPGIASDLLGRGGAKERLVQFAARYMEEPAAPSYMPGSVRPSRAMPTLLTCANASSLRIFS